MVTKNTWTKGLNSDISKLKTSNETYLDALNISIITQEGNSSYAAQSAKGTERTFFLPNTFSTWKFDVNNNTGDANFIFNIDGTIVNFTISDIETQTTEEIANRFNEEFSTTDIVAYYNTNYIVVYQYISVFSIISVTNCDFQRWTYTSGSFLLGWGFADNNLVVITGDPNIVQADPENYLEASMTRSGTVGCVWRIPIDPVTGSAIKPDGSLVPLGDTLLAKDFLVYKELLNLSRFYNIYKEVQCRKESETIFRAMFTDFYNDFRTLNLLEENIQASPVELINILPAVKASQPIITNIVEGGFLPTAKYQIWYQLSSSQGALSVISPLSKLVTIGGPETIQDYSGNVAGTNSGKSIEILIENIDTNYDNIRLGYTSYQVENLAESFYFDELPIPASGTLTTVLNGTEENIAVSDQTLLSNVNRPPTIAKTMAVVKNILSIANVKSRKFDVKFDARAYRFSSSQVAALYNTGDVYGSPTLSISYAGNFINNDGIITALNYSNLLNIPDTYDLINPYNDENPNNPLNGSVSPTNWNLNSQFKFQGNGTTIGGQGPNISFRFITKETIEDTNINTNRTSAPLIVPFTNVDESYDFGNYTQPINNGLSSMKSPYYDSLFWGYARGETYRWAIVFKDLYGFDSFAYWIGDIKFPNQDDNFPLAYESTSGELVSVQLGIEFTLDTSSPQFQAIKDKISGWSYVRLPRTVENKTKLGIGLLDNVVLLPASPVGIAYNNVFGAKNSPPSPAPIPSGSSTIHVLQLPSFHKSIDNQFKTNDYIEEIGEYVETSVGQLFVSILNLPASSTFTFNPRSVSPSTNYKNTVRKKWSVSNSRSQNYIPAEPSEGLSNPYINMTVRTVNLIEPDETKFVSLGNKTDLLSITTALPIKADNNKYAVSYGRYLNEQYGGFTRNARYNNTYIFTGHFQKYNFNDQVNPSKVFGGDVVSLMYSYQVQELNSKAYSGWEQDAEVLVAAAQFYPAEAHNFNPYYNVYSTAYTTAGEASYQRTTDSPIYEESIPVNRAYGQENTTSVIVSKPKRFNNIINEPFTIYASLPKIDGEKVDSWRNFQTNNFITVNGNYGPINRLIEFKDKLFFYQSNGVGVAAINERILINEGSTEQTQLGTGTVLQRFDYISTETGSIHQFAVEKSGNSIYHYDALLNKAFRFNQGMRPESDIKGLIGYFNKFDPTIKGGDQLMLTTGSRKGVHLGFDSRTNKVFFTLLGEDQEVTISYNELLNNGEGAFESRWSFEPRMYLNMRSFFLSIFESNNVQVHNIGKYNIFYDTKKECYIKFRNNLDSPDLVKVFDNLLLNTEVTENDVPLDETVTAIRFTNDYQDSGVLATLAGTNSSRIKKHLSSYRWNSIRNLSDKRRMYDKYIDVELTYLPPGLLVSDKRFILHDVVLENSMRTTIKPK